MRKVKDAVDLGTKEKIYFRGHAKATYMSDGRTVEDAIKSGGGSGYDDTELRNELTEQGSKLAELSQEIAGDNKINFSVISGTSLSPTAKVPFELPEGPFSIRFTTENVSLKVSYVALYFYDADNQLISQHAARAEYVSYTLAKAAKFVGAFIQGTDILSSGNILVEFEAEGLNKGILEAVDSNKKGLTQVQSQIGQLTKAIEDTNVEITNAVTGLGRFLIKAWILGYPKTADHNLCIDYVFRNSVTYGSGFRIKDSNGNQIYYFTTNEQRSGIEFHSAQLDNGISLYLILNWDVYEDKYNAILKVPIAIPYDSFDHLISNLDIACRDYTAIKPIILQENITSGVVAYSFQLTDEIDRPTYVGSTFSGSGMYVGNLKGTEAVECYFYCSNAEGNSTATEIMLQLRKNNYAGDIILTKKQQCNITPGIAKKVTFIFDSPIESDEDVFLTVRANSLGSLMRASTPNYPYTGEPKELFAYFTNKNMDEGKTPARSSIEAPFFLKAYRQITKLWVLSDSVVDYLSTRLNISSNKHVQLFLPYKIDAVVGDTLQVFYRGLMSIINPYQYDILISCDKGKQYPRYFEYTPQSSDVGETTFTVTLKDDDGNVVATESCILHTKAAPAEIQNNINIACFGDSLTVGGQWCAEAYRRLSLSGGNPEGLGLEKLHFVGKMRTSNGTGYYGEGGWRWNHYVTEGSRAFRFFVTNVNLLSIGSQYNHNGSTFTIKEINVTEGSGNILCSVVGANNPQSSGVLTKASGNGDASISFSSCVRVPTNPLWDATNNKMSFIPYANEYADGQLDVVYVLLGWNDVHREAYPYPTMMADCKTFIDTLHKEFPNAKVKLMGLQVCSINGGMGANYGATGSGYADTFGTIRKLMDLNQAYKDLAESSAYSSFVEYVDIASQFDSENNMPSAETKVNTRSSLTERRGTNGVHPSTDGYMQIADVVYRNIIANL